MSQEFIPIKQRLFTFATIRGYESIDQGQVSNTFITHPGINNSYFVSNNSSSSNSRISADQFDFDINDNYKTIRSRYKHFFELPNNFFTRPPENIAEFKPMDMEDFLMAWDLLFYELIFRKSRQRRKEAIKAIKVNHFISSIGATEGEILEVEAPKILIPLEIIAIIQAYFYDDCEGDLSGIDKLGVIEFRRVEQEVCCYVPGEVSHIENILAREFKEKHTRNLVSSEVTEELTTELEVENLTDTSTTTRNELNSEVDRVLSEESVQNYGGSLTVSGKIYGQKYNANAFADFSNNNSSTVSNNIAKTYAKEITERAVEKILQKTKKRRTSRILKEFEENNRHGFDNRAGNEHVTGIYRWVDKIYTNRLVNYGKRLVYKFAVYHPSKFYKIAMDFKPEKETEVNNPNAPTPPRTLPEIGLNSPDDISRENYQEFGNEYGIQLQAPKDASKRISASYSQTTSHKGNTQTTPTTNIQIDPDYIATNAKGSFNFDYRSRTGSKSSFYYTIGGRTGGIGSLRSWSRTAKSGSIDENFSHASNVAVSFKYTKCYAYVVSFKVTCNLKPQVFETWQSNTYNQIQRAYDSKFAEYEAALAQFESEQVSDEPVALGGNSNRNPLENRIIEQRELKRQCIDMMMRPFCKKLGLDFNGETDACEYPIPYTKQTKQYEKYIKYVKFFERAFDWDKMTYVFHPYYWADECDWAELLQIKHIDPIHQAFFQSGMAEIVVPIKCEMSLAVAYYIETGDIEDSEDLVPADLGDAYVSLANELQDCDAEVVVEGTWDSRLPTSLTILQKDSAMINEEGLPCCERIEEEGYVNTLEPNGNILSLLEGQEE